MPKLEYAPTKPEYVPVKIESAVTPNGIELTEEQLRALDYCINGKKQIRTLGGLAGVGKSTVISVLRKELYSWAVCAFTGKAANVLRRKGIHDASTIHSLIYKRVKTATGEAKFILKGEHELGIDGFIVDESSMISYELDRDLRTFNKPIIYVGDHGQLEPVGSERTNFNIMRNPDIKLETIHRNAGVIARFSMFLREGHPASDWRECGVDENGNEVIVIKGHQLRDYNIAASDQIICAYNKTRVRINADVRDTLGKPKDLPVAGDRIICLQNSANDGLFNGMQGTIDAIDDVRNRLLFTDDDGYTRDWVKYDPDAFGAVKTPKRIQGRVPFDYSYVITAHKSLGSEFDSVLVLEQRCDLWSHSRWQYTTASRAKKKLIWVLEN